VFDRNPEKLPEGEVASCLECIEDIGRLDLDALCDGKTSVGSGGMYSKLLAARRAAQLAVPTLILPGRTPFALERAFAGEPVGTWVMPEERTISRRKFWIAYHSEPSGTVWVDAGAAAALRDKDRSLLPVGVVKVEGNFGAGALVRILDPEGGPVGVGLSNYKAADLRRITGRKSAEIEALLGDGSFHEAVHRDNLLLDAAV
jgi:glutamate 5-kinase